MLNLTAKLYDYTLLTRFSQNYENSTYAVFAPKASILVDTSRVRGHISEVQILGM